MTWVWAVSRCERNKPSKSTECLPLRHSTVSALQAGWGPELTPSASCHSITLFKDGTGKALFISRRGSRGCCMQRVISLEQLSAAIIENTYSPTLLYYSTGRRLSTPPTAETVRHASCVSRRHAAMSQPRRDLPEADHKAPLIRPFGFDGGGGNRRRPHDSYSLGLSPRRKRSGNDATPKARPHPDTTLPRTAETR